MSFGKAKAPPPPNYGPIAEASQKAADMQYQLGREQLDWARQQYEMIWPYAQQYLTQQLGSSAEEADRAREARAMYETTYRPLEEQFAQTALNYNTPERAEANAGQAMADVANTFEAQRRTALANLESYGIDPSSTRFGALDLSSRIAQAAAAAAAGTQSRRNTEATGLALMGEAINIGKGYPGSIAQAYSTSTSAGKAGLGGANDTIHTGATTMGTPTDYYKGGTAALGTGATALNFGYNNALAGKQFDAQQSANFWSGAGNLIGGALGLALM